LLNNSIWKIYSEKVRYIRIDTPEILQNECFALEAKKKNEELVLGKKVRLKRTYLRETNTDGF